MSTEPGVVLGLNAAFQRRVAFEKPLVIGAVNRAAESGGGVDSNLHIAQESDTFEGLLFHLLYRSLSGHPAERGERKGGREDSLNLRPFVAGQRICKSKSRTKRTP